MTVLAAVLIIGGLLFALLFAVGTVVFFGMIVHAELSRERPSRTATSSAIPAARVNARPATQPTRTGA